MENLNAIKVIRKTGQENFTFQSNGLDYNLTDFWAWSMSDLLSNAQRGVLAEFIVKKDLGISGDTRLEWDDFDIRVDGLNIEVKSSAYLQSWKQDKLSVISFNIAPSKGWNAKTNEYSQETKRRADFYVFCILNHKNKLTVDPMNLNQWDFYVLPTKVLDDKKKNQRTLVLSSLISLEPIACKYGQIKDAINQFKKSYDIE